MRFRPCIDLHQGVVKQIVGGSLDDEQTGLVTNFVAQRPPEWFADRYRQDRLFGGHVIMLGPGNEQAAAEALRAFPGGLQIGGGITVDNAPGWLEQGASAVIVTSYVFHEGQVDGQRLAALSGAVGPERLVLDLSCRRRGVDYRVVTDRWQRFTDESISPALLDRLAEHCGEFLVHGVDVEGRRQGIEAALVERLGRWAPIPVTYAGGVRSQADIDQIEALGNGRVDFTVGSALDLFGGDLSYRLLAERYGRGA